MGSMLENPLGIHGLGTGNFDFPEYEIVRNLELGRPDNCVKHAGAKIVLIPRLPVMILRRPKFPSTQLRALVP